MIELDLLFAETGASAETAAAASARNFPIPLPLKRSSCVASATYSPFDGILDITFQSGETVTHQDVDIITILNWFRAASVGGYYNSAIKGR
jgi:KTSC domain